MLPNFLLQFAKFKKSKTLKKSGSKIKTLFKASNSFNQEGLGYRRAQRSSPGHVTSTPNRQSAPNLSSMLNSPIEPQLTAEIDLSDELGVAPIHDSHEDTPMFTPRTNSRIVRIISKQSNV